MTTTTRNAITWGKRTRPRKKDQGHSAIRYGWRRPERGRHCERSYVLCQCSKRPFSGYGSFGGADSHRKHQKRELRKLANAA